MNVDLTTSYLGLQLSNPLVASSSSLTGTVDSIRKLEQVGIAAVVLPSLFEEQIEHLEMEMHRLYDYREGVGSEAVGYYPELASYNMGPEQYLASLKQAKDAVGIPVIASLNGQTAGGWVRYAKRIEASGADALELNIYWVPTDASLSSNDVEERYIQLILSVRESISIPIAVKIGPFFSNMASFAHQLENAGVNGLVLFNRYLEPDIDLESMTFEPKLALSQPRELFLPLRWIAILSEKVTMSLAATSGVHEYSDMLKALLVGADVTMIASALLERGPEHVAKLLQGLQQWMQEREYRSVAQLKGSMNRAKCADPGSLERANYTRALCSFTDIEPANPS